MSFINEQVPSVSEEELTSTFNQVMRHVSLWMGLGCAGGCVRFVLVQDIVVSYPTTSLN